MPSLKDIRRRVGSVKKTQQITRAMRMVAAAKLRRAQDAILAARPYAERMAATLAEVSRTRTDSVHPLLAEREEVRRGELVVVTSDRGLCGAYNANVLRAAQGWLAERGPGLEAVSLVLVGRKAVDFFRRRRPGDVAETQTGIASVEYAHAVRLAQLVSGRFLTGQADEVTLIGNEFLTTMTQRPRTVRLLPLAAGGAEGGDGALPYEIEPDAESLLGVLAPKALEVEIFRALLENQAGEYAARMTAMESATRNTEELIERLTLQYNRARQAAITKELVEIVSGAEAL